MNRIILIGNGFDLAHGMKTSYKDFILDYLRTSISIAKEVGRFEDLLIRITKRENFITPENLNKNIAEWEIKDIMRLKESPNIPITNLTLPTNEKCEFSILIKTEFLDIILNFCDNFNWVDVENEYYNLLCTFSNKKKIREIKELNKQFQFIQDLLQIYLVKIEELFLNKDSSYFRRIPLSEQLTQKLYNNKIENKPESILFLNFNYTSTIEDYLLDIKNTIPNTKIINIHGKLSDKTNPMIFGYGDEDSTDFETLEKYNECLEFVKTYRYLRTHNYQKLLEFIDSNEYDVIIMGHSCGLSDRTLLSEIFNNNQCKSIRVLTYNKMSSSPFCVENSDYIEKTYSIGRIFKKKGNLRRKLLPFELNDLLQVTRIHTL
ncbi:AbiH family protein [Elizabethkingia anophelis]|uniref:AbiH family protein n=1 Tax=Elizabethkingia anophelis TaxID=1117645 RepID=UPI0038926FBB|nr:hypothetical protein [Elizabethkingia anophelis]MCT4219280.1 hypothetical protein [Elizabethkingia anophelis]